MNGLCDRCQRPAYRSLAAEDLCAGCYSVVLDPIRQRVAERAGIDGWGRKVGPGDMRGPDLLCDRCGATWHGLHGEPCWWCQRHRELIEDHQRAILLACPEVDPADVLYTARMSAWAGRLRRAVEIGLLTRPEAEAAYRKAVGHVAA